VRAGLSLPYIFAALSLGGWALAVPPGPSLVELAAVIRVSPDRLRGLRCEGFEEEPSEFVCLYQRRTAANRWIAEEIHVAISGRDWAVIDGPHPADPNS